MNYSASTNMFRAEAKSGSNIAKTNAHSGFSQMNTHLVAYQTFCSHASLAPAAVSVLSHLCVDEQQTYMHTLCPTTQIYMKIWVDIFLSAGYQRALIEASYICSIHLKESKYMGVQGASFFALLHQVIMEWVIQPSGKSCVKRQTEYANTPDPTDTQALDATLRWDNRKINL